MAVRRSRKRLVRPAKPPELPPIDAEGILRSLTKVREAIPERFKSPPKAKKPEKGLADEHAFMTGPMDADALREFDYLAVADGLESVAAEISEAVERMNAKLIDDALRIYYAAEELARDPEHSELVARVEEMREAYKKSYGKAIPSRAEAEKTWPHLFPLNVAEREGKKGK
jgi:hypothetical protein